MITSLLHGTDDRWEVALTDLTHDFYQTSAYHRFEQANGEGEPFAFLAEDRTNRLLWPYLLKEVCIPGVGPIPGLSEVRSCYGYPGPVCTPEVDREFLGRAMEELHDTWRTQGVVNAFTRLHPVFESPVVVESLASGQHSRLVCHGKTVSIDLTLDNATRIRRYSETFRKGVRRNKRAGLQTTLDTTFAHLPDFYRFYMAAMDRNNAIDYYYFQYDYFERLISHNSGVIHLFVTRANETPACAALISEYGQQLQALFIMNNLEFLDCAPARTLVDDVCEWGHARGASDFHLGGGRGGAQDSLFRFKAGFSDIHRDFYTHRLITNAAEYERLVSLRAEISPINAEDGFFPIWRKPVPAMASATNGLVTNHR